MFEGLAKVAGAIDTAPYQRVNMETDELPENARAAGKDQSEICHVYVAVQRLMEILVWGRFKMVLIILDLI